MPRRRPAGTRSAASSDSTVEGDRAASELVPAKESTPAEAAPETTESRPPGGYRLTRDGEPVRCAGWMLTERGWALQPIE